MGDSEGASEGVSDSVEVFNPTTGQSCELPSLPDERFGHIMDNLTICGGMDPLLLQPCDVQCPTCPNCPCPTCLNCLTFSSGQWETSHALTVDRFGHTSWSTDTGIILLGGYVQETDYMGGNTTETVTEAEYNGVPGFPLHYITL